MKPWSLRRTTQSIGPNTPTLTGSILHSQSLSTPVEKVTNVAGENVTPDGGDEPQVVGFSFFDVLRERWSRELGSAGAEWRDLESSV